jgi:hypothetical protein
LALESPCLKSVVGSKTSQNPYITPFKIEPAEIRLCGGNFKTPRSDNLVLLLPILQDNPHVTLNYRRSFAVI